MKRKLFTRPLAMLLTLALTASLTGLTALAEETEKIILAFAALERTEITVQAGAKEAQALKLPETLSVTLGESGQEELVSDPENRQSIQVTWKSEPDYDPLTPDTYLFTAGAAGYATAAGVDWPQITVTATGAARYTRLGNTEKQPQTVKFHFRPKPDNPNIVVISPSYGDVPYSFAATSDSSGTITYTSSNTSVATVDVNGLVTYTGAGTTTITATAAETDTHLKGSDSYDLTVAPKKVTITGIKANDLEYAPAPDPSTQKYGVELDFRGAVIDGKIDGDDVTIDSSGAIGRVMDYQMNVGVDVPVVIAGLALGGTKAGSYLLNYNPDGPYPNLTVKINPRTVTSDMIADIPAQPYTGVLITPVLTVTDSGKSLKDGKDYTVSYTNNTDTGTAIATITGIENYKGKAFKPFSIVATAAATVTAEELNLNYGDTLTVNVTGISAANTRSLASNTVGLYRTDGTELATANVTNDSAVLTYDTKSKKLPVGTSTLTVKYGGSSSLLGGDLGTVSVTLETKSLIASITEGDASASKLYDGTSEMTNVKLTLTGVENGDAVTAKATGRTIDEYAGVQPFTSTAVTLEGEDKDWYAEPTTVFGSVTITAAPQTLSSSHTSEQNAYSLVAGGTLDLTTLVSGAATGNPLTFAISSGREYATLNGAALTAKNRPGTVAVTANAGAHDVDGDGNNEYSAASALTIYIKAAEKQMFPVAVTIKDRYYGDNSEQPKPENLPTGGTEANCTYSYSGRDSTVYGPSPALPIEVGSYTVTMTYEDGTYKGIATADFNVLKKPLTINRVIIASKTYDGKNTVRVDSVSFIDNSGIDISVSYTAGGIFDSPNAGYGKTVTVTVRLIGSSVSNYILTKDFATLANQTIEKATAPALSGQNLLVQTGATANASLSLAGLMPTDAGQLHFAKGTTTDAHGIVASWDVDVNGRVSVTPSGSGADGQTATLPVTISSENYEDATVPVTMTLTSNIIKLNIIPPGHGTLVVRESSSSGKALADGDNVLEGTTVWAAASADPGWQVDGIEIAGRFTSGDSASQTLTGDGTRSISARISRVPSNSPAQSPSYTEDPGNRSSSDEDAPAIGGDSPSGTAQTADRPSSNVDRSGGVNPTDAVRDVEKMIAEAVRTGETPRASVNVRNAEFVSPETLREMSEAAENADGSAQLLADTTKNGKIVARMYIDAADAANLPGNIQLGVSADPKATKATRDLFRSAFQNELSVIHMEHQGPIGMRVRVAVKMDIGFDPKNAVIYAYDKKTNSYTLIENPEAWVDEAGYFHFFTDRGGDIIVSNGELVKR